MLEHSLVTHSHLKCPMCRHSINTVPSTFIYRIVEVSDDEKGYHDQNVRVSSHPGDEEPDDGDDDETAMRLVMALIDGNYRL